MPTPIRGRRALLVSALLATLALPLLVAVPAQARFGDKTLREGSSGRDVKVLQRWLTRIGFETTADGQFGRGTKRNVAAFERANKRRANGILSTSDAELLRKLAREAYAKQQGGGAQGGNAPAPEPGAGGSDSGTGVTQVYLGARRRATFSYQAAGAGPVQVDVLNRSGAVVASVTDKASGAGTQRVTWNGDLASGKPAPEGLYGFRLAGGQARASANGSPDQPFDLRWHVFPIRGKHDYGTTTNRFGARGGSHKGHDTLAACGTRLVAAEVGKVKFAGYQSAAGNYVVIRGGVTGEDYVYMHMRDPARYSTGQSVPANATIGLVGQTGRATACHLHFEIWTKPGWYDGGQPRDPLPDLKLWDGWS